MKDEQNRHARKVRAKGVPVWQAPAEAWGTLRPLARQMRREPTEAEQMLWNHLRDRQLLGMRFRRQHVIHWFIADFYCAEARLVIEVDGGVHRRNRGQDEWREGSLEGLRLRVLGFSNDEVMHSLPVVLQRISAEVSKSASGEPHPLPPLRARRGGECQQLGDVGRTRGEVLKPIGR